MYLWMVISVVLNIVLVIVIILRAISMRFLRDDLDECLGSYRRTRDKLAEATRKLAETRHKLAETRHKLDEVINDYKKIEDGNKILSELLGYGCVVPDGPRRDIGKEDRINILETQLRELKENGKRTGESFGNRVGEATQGDGAVVVPFTPGSTGGVYPKTNDDRIGSGVDSRRSNQGHRGDVSKPFHEMGPTDPHVHSQIESGSHCFDQPHHGYGGCDAIPCD